MALTTDELLDLRGDIGDTGATPVFTDAELQRLYTRSGDTYAGTVVYALRQLLVNAAKFTDYTVGQTSEKKSQIFTQLRAMLTGWENIAGVGGGQLQIGTLDLGIDDDTDGTLTSRVDAWS